MRIAYIITRADEIGGAQVHVRDIATALYRAGHDVTVIAGRAGALADQLAEQGVPCRTVSAMVRQIAPSRDYTAFQELRTLLCKLHPDLVSTHSSKAGWLGRLAARTLNVPVLFTAHGWAFTDGVSRGARLLYVLAERLAAPLADRIITVSGYDRTLALKKRIAPPDKITCIHNGVHDCGVGDCQASGRPGTAPPRIVMTGRFSSQKDHASLLQALARLRRLDWTLDLVGDGALQSDAAALAGSLGIADRIRFLGARDDVCRVLHSADIYCLVSNWEGLPRSILEAMSAELPVLASNVGGVSEAVQEGVSGFLVPRGDSQMLTEKLQLLVTDGALRRSLGRGGRRLYEQEFQFERMLARTVAVYRQVLARKAPV